MSFYCIISPCRNHFIFRDFDFFSHGGDFFLHLDSPRNVYAWNVSFRNVTSRNVLPRNVSSWNVSFRNVLCSPAMFCGATFLDDEPFFLHLDLFSWGDFLMGKTLKPKKVEKKRNVYVLFGDLH